MSRFILAVASTALLGSGCMYATSAHATKGRVFVVKQSFLSSTFWNCDATKGDPTCYEVKQIKNGE